MPIKKRVIVYVVFRRHVRRFECSPAVAVWTAVVGWDGDVPHLVSARDADLVCVRSLRGDDRRAGNVYANKPVTTGILSFGMYR
jgi:hypothetical protein